MKNIRSRNGPFHRIGDTYGHFINTEHFMGRDAFEDNWMTGQKKRKEKTVNHKEVTIKK